MEVDKVITLMIQSWRDLMRNDKNRESVNGIPDSTLHLHVLTYYNDSEVVRLCKNQVTEDDVRAVRIAWRLTQWTKSSGVGVTQN